MVKKTRKNEEEKVVKHGAPKGIGKKGIGKPVSKGKENGYTGFKHFEVNEPIGSKGGFFMASPEVSHPFKSSLKSPLLNYEGAFDRMAREDREEFPTPQGVHKGPENSGSRENCTKQLDF